MGLIDFGNGFVSTPGTTATVSELLQRVAEPLVTCTIHLPDRTVVE